MKAIGAMENGTAVDARQVLLAMFRRDPGFGDALRVVVSSWTRAGSTKVVSRTEDLMVMASAERASSWSPAPACTSGTG